MHPVKCELKVIKDEGRRCERARDLVEDACKANCANSVRGFLRDVIAAQSVQSSDAEILAADWRFRWKLARLPSRPSRCSMK